MNKKNFTLNIITFISTHNILFCCKSSKKMKVIDIYYIVISNFFLHLIQNYLDGSKTATQNYLIIVYY